MYNGAAGADRVSGRTATDEVMGIRFLCPTCGNRLNVKAFLAGKRGVCPQCSNGLDIPLESQITKGTVGGGAGGTSSPGSEDDGQELAIPMASPAAPRMLSVSPVSPSLQPSPVMTPAAFNPAARPKSSTPLAGGPGPISPSTSAARSVPMQPAAPVQPSVPMQPALPVQPSVPMQPALPVQPALPMQPMVPMQPVAAQPMAPVMAPTAPLPDPIEEAPQAIWYVRPPSGGQYGPARGEVMRKWIGEGRVSPDSLVWREGWGDWRTAAEAFPALGMVTPPMPAPVTPATYAASGTPAYTAAAVRPKRRNSTAMAITIVSVLGLMCVALFVTLILVLMR